MAFVQSANTGAGYVGGGTTSFTLTFPVAISAAGAIAGTFSWDDTATVVSIIDDKSNSYSVKDSIDDTANGQAAASFVLGGINNGPKTLTFTFSSAVSFGWAAADEHSGRLAAADPSDGHAASLQTQSTGATLSSGSIVTTINGDTIWGGGDSTVGGVSGVIAGLGFTSRNNSTVGAFNNLFVTEDANQTTAGSTAATIIVTSATAVGGFAVFVIALKPSGAPPPATIWVPQGDNNVAVAISARAKAAAAALLAGAVWVPTAPVAPSNSKPAGWYQPLSVALPVAKAIQPQTFVPFNTPQVSPPVPYGWLSIASAAPPLTAAQSGFTFVPFDTRQTNTATIDKWQQPLARAVPAPLVQLGSAYVPFLGYSQPWGWHQPLSTAPLLTQAQPGYFSVPFNTAQITITPPWGWLSPLSTPPPTASAQLGSTFVPFNTVQITPAPPWGWFAPLATTPRAAVATQPQPAWSPAPFPTFSLAWQQPLAATPARYAAQQGILSLPFVIPIPANTVVGMPWQQPLAGTPHNQLAAQSVTFVPFNTTQTIIATTLIQRTLTGVGL